MAVKFVTAKFVIVQFVTAKFVIVQFVTAKFVTCEHESKALVERCAC